MLKIYCPTCNGQLELADNLREAVCIHCGRRVIIPQGYSREQSSLLFAAEARLRGDYATAEKSYVQTIRDYPDSAAAHWGLALARFKVGYQPIGNNEYRLVCDQAERGGFSADEDVREALNLSEGAEREEYREEAAKIDALLEKVKEYASLHDGCDVLVDAGASDEAGRRRAEEIAVMLRTAGLRVFCVPAECADMPRQDWEPALYRAFSTAGVMILTAGSPSAFDPDLVYDAQRMLHRRAEAQRNASKRIPGIYLLFSGLDEYSDIPDELFDGIDIRFPDADENSADYLREAALDTIRVHQKALKAESKNIDDQGYSNRLGQARLALERGDFRQAENMYEAILNENARESQAYLGLVLAENRCKDVDDLIEKGIDLSENANFKNALVFANERERQVFTDIRKKADDRRQILERQQEEEEKARRQYEAEQEKKQREIQESIEKKEQEEADARKRSRRKVFVLLGILVLAAIGGLIGYKYYNSTTKANKLAYRAATILYEEGKYEEAAAAFEELAAIGYKDSGEMYAKVINLWDAEIYNGQLADYNDALSYGADLNERARAVNTLESVKEAIPEASDQLDAWFQEGMDYFEQGQYTEAYLAMKAFDGDDPDLLRVKRVCHTMNESRSSLSDNFAMAAIDKETGTVISVNCPTLQFEDGEAISVALSISGSSAAVVRADGTVYLTGSVSGADVSGWTNVRMVQTTDGVVFGLTNDHKLLRTNGSTIENVRHFDINSYGDYILCKTDGSVQSSFPDSEAELSGWTEVAAVGMLDSSVLKAYALREDGTLYSNVQDVSNYEDVMAIATGGGRFGAYGEDVLQGTPTSVSLCNVAEVKIYNRSAALSNQGIDPPIVELRKFVRDQLP